jgi:RHS repeat-associated protein
MTDGATGKPLAFHDYVPFGEEIQAGVGGRSTTYYPSGALAINDAVAQKFTGKERDQETGLDFFDARYFASPQGRFTNPDHYNIIAEAQDREQFKTYVSQPQNWNRYSYVWNSPLGHVDPTGETVYVVTYTYGNEQGDEEFKRAAETRANEIQSSEGFDPKKDTVVVAGVNSFAGFKSAIDVANGLEKQFGKVGEVDIFSHAGWDGPNFQEGHNYGQVPPRYSNEQNPSGLSQLHVNWDSSAHAGFYGCHTDFFAQKYANSQGVPTYGIEGSSMFSALKNWGTVGNVLFRLHPSSQNLYMVSAGGGAAVRKDPQPEAKPKL